MRRTLVGTIWAIGIYFIGDIMVGIIAGEAVEKLRPVIAMVAAGIGALGSWMGYLPGSVPKNRQEDKSSSGRKS